MVDMWAGIGAGKREHHCVVIDADGTQLLSQRITNDEETLLGLIADVCSLADGGHVTWAIDLNSGGAALVLTLLANHDQLVFYIPGRIIHHAAATYRGMRKRMRKTLRSSLIKRGCAVTSPRYSPTGNSARTCA